MEAPKTYKAFKDIPLKKDTNHEVHLNVMLNHENVPIYTVMVRCLVTNSVRDVLTTIVKGEAKDRMRKKANELNCFWKDNTK